MAYKMFHKKNLPQSGPVFVSIGKGGFARLSSEADRRLKLLFGDKVKFVHLLFNKEKMRIGIVPAEKADENTYPLTSGVSVKGLLTFHDLNEYADGKRKKVTFMKKAKLLEIHLVSKDKKKEIEDFRDSLHQKNN